MPARFALTTTSVSITHAQRVMAIGFLLFIGLFDGGMLRAQDQNRPFEVPHPFLRDQFFNRGEFFRAYQIDFDKEHSWTSHERLLRSEAAIYADLHHAALLELQDLKDVRANGQYRATAALRTGLLQLKAESYGQARLSLNDAITEQSGPEYDLISGEALFWIGASHILESGRGGYTLAATSFNECVNEFPANPRADDALYYLGQIEESRDHHEEALLLYNDMLNRYPESDYRIAAAIRRTQLLNMLRRFDEAMEQLGEAETMWSWYKSEEKEGTQRFADKADLELVLLRGEISINRHDLPGAERAYLTLLYTLEGGYQRTGTLGLAETYRVAGLVDSAVTLYDRILLDGNDDDAGMQADFFRAFTLIDSDKQRREEGLRKLEEIAFDPEHMMQDNARLVLGDQAYRNGNYAGAVEWARQVMNTSPQPRLRARAGLIEGSGLMEEEEYGKAAISFTRSYDEALPIPENIMPERRRVLDVSLRMKCVALYWAGRYDDAISAINQYLRDPYSREEIDTVHVPPILALKGEAEYELQRYGDAIRTLEQVVETWPTSKQSEPALYTIGWSHLQKSDFREAEGAFARLVKAFPLSSYAVEAQIRRGDCLYLTRQFGKAAEAYKGVETMSPSEPESEYASYQRSMATWQSGDSAEARHQFAMFVTSHSRSEWADDALFMGGLLDYRTGDYEGAIRVMRQLLETYRGSRLHARAYYTIADSYYRLQKFDESLAAYSIVTERFPESSYSQDAETGIVFARAAKQKAEDHTQMGALQVNEVGGRPSYEIELRRAQIFLDASRIEDAELEYLQFIERNPTSPNLPAGWFGLAECALLRRDTTAAIDTLQVLVSRFNAGQVVPMAALRLSDLRLARKDTTGAIEALDQLRLRFPESAALMTALLREAELVEQSGKMSEAVNLLRGGVGKLDTLSGHLTRTGGKILSDLARLELLTGDTDSARARWRLLSSREDSLGADAIIQLGENLLLHGQSVEAVSTYGQASRRFETQPELRARLDLGLGRAYEFEGNLTGAAEIYRSIVERLGDAPLAREASRRLEEMKDL